MVNTCLIPQLVMDDSKNHIAIWDFILHKLSLFCSTYLFMCQEKNNFKVGNKNQIIFHKKKDHWASCNKASETSIVPVLSWSSCKNMAGLTKTFEINRHGNYCQAAEKLTGDCGLEWLLIIATALESHTNISVHVSNMWLLKRN